MTYSSKFRYVLVLLSLTALVRIGEPQTQASGDDYRLSVSVDLVALQATVHDRNGGYVSDLREQNFQVYEDGVRQSIRLFRHEDVPVTVGLIIDHSSSMRRKLPRCNRSRPDFRRIQQSGRSDVRRQLQ